MRLARDIWGYEFRAPGGRMMRIARVGRPPDAGEYEVRVADGQIGLPHLIRAIESGAVSMDSPAGRIIQSLDISAIRPAPPPGPAWEEWWAAARERMPPAYGVRLAEAIRAHALALAARLATPDVDAPDPQLWPATAPDDRRIF